MEIGIASGDRVHIMRSYFYLNHVLIYAQKGSGKDKIILLEIFLREESWGIANFYFFC